MPGHDGSPGTRPCRPAPNPGPYPAYAPGSDEFVLVDSRTLRLEIGPEDLALHAGDSVYFPADATHRYANPGAVPCVYYVAALIMRPR
jgi:XRE family transcriptional regulator, regulator of sulfur utilization